MSTTHLRLMELHVQALYLHDRRGRLVEEHDFGEGFKRYEHRLSRRPIEGVFCPSRRLTNPLSPNNGIRSFTPQGVTVNVMAGES